MKRLFVVILSFVCLHCYADTAIEIVEKFAFNLENWSLTKDINTLRNLDNYSTRQTIILDKIAEALAEKNNVAPNNTYRLDLYLTWLQKEFASGSRIATNQIEYISTSELSNIDTKQCEIVKCIFSLTGSSNVTSEDIIYVRNGKVLKIDNYVEITTVSGKKKVKVDFSDIDTNKSSWGISYNYSKNFPFGISVNYCPVESPIMVGIDFGWSANTDAIVNETMDYQDVGNFKFTREELKPKFYLVFTPSYIYKYFSIGLGFGSMFYSGKEYVEHYQYNPLYDSSSDGILSINGSFRSNDKYDSSVTKKNFMLRPNFKIYLPINGNKLYLTAGIGYDYIFKYAKQNGINFGLGIHVPLY